MKLLYFFLFCAKDTQKSKKVYCFIEVLLERIIVRYFEDSMHGF